MGTTTKYALPYPELSDSANVPRDQKALAEAVEAALLTDTGWVTATFTGVGWTQNVPVGVRRIGRVVYTKGRILNAAFVNTTFQVVATLPAGYRPFTQMNFPSAVYGTVNHWRSWQIGIDGTLAVASSAAANVYTDFYVSYLIPD